MTDPKADATAAARALATGASSIDQAVAEHRTLEGHEPQTQHLYSGATPTNDDPVRGPLRGEAWLEAFKQALDYRLSGRE